MAQVETITKQDISRRQRVLRYVGDAGASATPIILRLIFSLLAVKMIAVLGSDGALTKWGIAQNTVILLAAAMGFSVQTGVAARTANGEDRHALGRGAQLLLVGTAVALFTAAILLYLDFGWMPSPAYTLVALVAAFSAAMGTLVSTYLPAVGRVYALSAFYFSIGAITCGLLLVVEVQSIIGLMLAIGIGWAGGVLMLILSCRQLRQQSVWLLRWDYEKNRSLLAYGAISLTNAIAQIGAIILARDAVIEAAGLQISDLFESGLRLATIVEGVVGSIVGIMLWRRIAGGETDLLKTAMVMTVLAIVAVFCAYVVFSLHEELFVTLLFTEKFAAITEDSERIFLLAALKAAYAALIIPAYICGKTKKIIMIECAYAGAVFIQLKSLSLLSSPAAAFDVLIYSAVVSVGLLLCVLVLEEKTSRRAKPNI